MDFWRSKLCFYLEITAFFVFNLVRKLHGFSANMHAVAEKMWKEELAKETKPSGSKMNRRPEETWVTRKRREESLGFIHRTFKTCTNKKFQVAIREGLSWALLRDL